MKKMPMVSLLLSACPDEPEWMFEVQICEVEGGFATVQEVILF